REGILRESRPVQAPRKRGTMILQRCRRSLTLISRLTVNRRCGSVNPKVLFLVFREDLLFFLQIWILANPQEDLRAPANFLDSFCVDCKLSRFLSMASNRHQFVKDFSHLHDNVRSLIGPYFSEDNGPFLRNTSNNLSDLQ